jgi:hypothetical protein
VVHTERALVDQPIQHLRLLLIHLDHHFVRHRFPFRVASTCMRQDQVPPRDPTITPASASRTAQRSPHPLGMERHIQALHTVRGEGI